MAEVWVLNSTLQITKALSSSGGFTSNGETFSLMKTTTDGRLRFYGASGNYMDVYANNAWVTGIGDYKSVTFSEAQVDSFRAWLESNATLQEDTTVVEYLTTDTDLIKVANAIRAKSGTTAKLSFPDGFALAISSIPGVSVQPSKALTITSNGTVSVTPDAPYDALKKVDVTVDVASGGGTETTSVDVYGRSNTIDMPIFCTWQTANGWLGTSEFELTNSNGDFLFTIPDVLVGGYIVFTKDPMNQALFNVNVASGSGVEGLDVNPMPSSGDTANASTVVKVVEPGANFELWVSSA